MLPNILVISIVKKLDEGLSFKYIGELDLSFALKCISVGSPSDALFEPRFIFEPPKILLTFLATLLLPVNELYPPKLVNTKYCLSLVALVKRLEQKLKDTL